MEDTWEYLKTENSVPKFESYIRGWMKQIQELLLESEQLRLETDDAGPQVISVTINVQNTLILVRLVQVALTIIMGRVPFYTYIR